MAAARRAARQDSKALSIDGLLEHLLALDRLQLVPQGLEVIQSGVDLRLGHKLALQRRDFIVDFSYSLLGFADRLLQFDQQ